MSYTKCLWVVSVLIFVAISVSFLASADGQAAPATTNGSVAFKVHCAEIVDSMVTTCLTVAKPGKKPLVNGSPGAGEIDGNHNFPPNTTAAGVGAYYRGLLIGAEWKDPEDFTIKDGTINFTGITKLDAGSNHSHLLVSGQTDSADLVFTTVTPINPALRTVRIERPGQTMDGILSIAGFGVHGNEDGTLTTSTSTAAIHFLHTDSATEVLERIRDSLQAQGWEVTMGMCGPLQLTKNASGHPICSLWCSVRYLETEGHTENDDHWVFFED